MRITPTCPTCGRPLIDGMTIGSAAPGDPLPADLCAREELGDDPRCTIERDATSPYDLLATALIDFLPLVQAKIPAPWTVREVASPRAYKGARIALISYTGPDGIQVIATPGWNRTGIDMPVQVTDADGHSITTCDVTLSEASITAYAESVGQFLRDFDTTTTALLRLTVPMVAGRFTRELEDELSTEQMAEVRERNEARLAPDRSCSSHDFCDANIVMQRALVSLGVPESATTSDDRILALWNEAWAYAKARGFRA